MRIGVVGTKWGLMHVGAFRDAGAEVVAICGNDSQRTHHIAQREGIAQVADDVRQLASLVDVVVVASPDALHLAHVCIALEENTHVLCEKPLTRTLEEAETLRERVLSASRTFAISFPFRSLSSLLVLKQWLESRGRVRKVQAQVRTGFISPLTPLPGAPRLGDSGDFGGASHLLDTAFWLADDSPGSLRSMVNGSPVHSIGLLIEGTGGTQFHLSHVAATRRSNIGDWALMGDGWEARFRAGYEPRHHGWVVSPIEVFVEGEHQDWVKLAPASMPQDGEPEPWAAAHRHQARLFLEAVRGRRSKALGTIDDGVRVQAALHRALRQGT